MVTGSDAGAAGRAGAPRAPTASIPAHGGMPAATGRPAVTSDGHLGPAQGSRRDRLVKSWLFWVAAPDMGVNCRCGPVGFAILLLLAAAQCVCSEE
jgi:hypothetical protein